jgi:hypothetical protein
VEIVNAINKDDPVAIQHMIDKTATEPEFFRDIDPYRFAQFKERLRAAYDVAVNRSNKRTVEQEGDRLLAGYRSDGSLRDVESKEFDPLAAIKRLDDEPDVPTEVKKYVRSELDAEAADRKRFADEKSDKAEKEISGAVGDHKFLEARQLLRQHKTALGKRAYEEWDKIITSRAIRTDEDIPNSENTREYIRIRDMIDEGKDSRSIEKAITGSASLRDATRRNLFDRLDMERDKTLKAGLAAGERYLHSQIAPGKGALLPPIPAEEARSSEAQQALSDWVKAESRKRTEGKQPPLSEREIFDYAKQMAPSYQMPIAEKLQHMQEEISSPKEGATKTNNSGDRVVFKSGKWVLQ